MYGSIIILNKMLYSIRTFSRGYYIGYAESIDGIHWNRKDNEAGIELSEKGFDDKNISYPYLINLPDSKDVVMFYNGNNCGKTGFGWARQI